MILSIGLEFRSQIPDHSADLCFTQSTNIYYTSTKELSSKCQQDKSLSQLLLLYMLRERNT